LSIQDEIFQWVKGREAWQQELFLRAAATPELDEKDIEEVASILLGDEVEGAGPRVVTRDDLPDSHGADQPMVVHRLADLQNVNAIAAGETLPFAPAGLNVVYGRNGAGKTGYSRVFKHAGRTLYRETVLNNVADEDAGSPRATITIEIDGLRRDETVTLDEVAPALLARICVADAKAGERCLTHDSEVDYAPESLKSLSRLAEAMRAVEAELDRRLGLVRPAEIDLAPFGADTAAARFLAGLSATDTPADLAKLASLSAEEQAERERLRRKLGEIDAQQAPQLRRAAEGEARAAASLQTMLAAVAAKLSDEQVLAAAKEAETLRATADAAQVAARRFEGEPLGGVGSDPWKMLWSAAHAYALHLEEQLPPDHDPAHCLLCMQELDATARVRLAGFDEFVKDDISARLRAAELAIATRREDLPDLVALRATHAEALQRLGSQEGQAGAPVAGWLKGAEAVVDRLRRGEYEGLSGVEAPPAELEAWIAGRRADAAAHAELERPEDQQEIRAALAELDGRQALSGRSAAILARLAGLKKVAAIEVAKAKTKTGEVSRKITKFSSALVESDLQSALEVQLAALDFRGLEVEPKARTKAGAPMMGLKFKTVDGAPLTAVLSQGEQRRLALAAFLAEMEVLPGGSPVVFDDPATSIDQEGRRHIARTIARLAADRQVIVFTHEMSFVHELQRQADIDVPLNIQHVVRIGDSTGNVRPSLPWEGLASSKRKGPLGDSLAAVRKAYETGDPDIYTGPVHEFCRMLREAFERTVEDRILAGVITRREDAVHTRKMDRIHCTTEICAMVDRGMSENSAWVHDRPAGDGTVIPTVAELQEGLDLYIDLHGKLGEADAAREAAAKANEKPKATLAAVAPAPEVEVPGEQATLAVVPDKDSREPA
jgi:ABC-type transport system involved in cytochrome c biogenesis ATPase subunit